jgi:hypothetical protein
MGIAMGVTAIKRIENRGSTNLTLVNRENDRIERDIAPGSARAVDIWIPWASNATEFGEKCLEVRQGGTTRYWIWQAWRGDGDYVRYSTDGAWHDPGARVNGLPDVNGDRTFQVYGHSMALALHRAGPIGASITAIRRIENQTRYTVSLYDRENDRADGHNVAIGPGASLNVNMWVPWAATATDFHGHHLQLRLNGQPRFWIWQAANADGDFVRCSTNGAWRDQGDKVEGFAGVDGDRTLVVLEDHRGPCFALMPSSLGFWAEAVTWLVTAYPAYVARGFRICGGTPVRDSIPSVPKSSAVAFSIAGPASDVYDRKLPGARYRYRDSGKRYEVEIRNGTVYARHPDGREDALTQMVSHSRLRAGEMSAAPPFDLIAASNGRLFAKERGRDRFFFTTMDETFIHADKQGRELAVPSSYYKIDPEFNAPNAQLQHLTTPFAGCFAGHPAAERFPLFGMLVQRNIIDMMLVRLQRRVWHLLDARPPLNRFNPQVALAEAYSRSLVLRLTDTQTAPPDGIPTYQHVTYCQDQATMSLASIDFAEVLDIGLGHVHWHEQDDRTGGGEIQPLRSGPGTAPIFFSGWFPNPDYAYLYRVANGPIRDGDGYIDGTCNYYALVRLRNGTYRLLYLDEQMFASQRWRLVDPDDDRGLSFAIAKALRNEPGRYDWNPATYWCPFRAGKIGPRSRLAAARQVLLVTGSDPTVIYGINFSWSSIDRTWRWRTLPPAATARTYDPIAVGGAEPDIPTNQGACVYPQTIRLREDLTIHLGGAAPGASGQVERGRWYQRYLPASLQLTPIRTDLPAGGPNTAAQQHHWKFLPEDVFRRADRFSHFGVYAEVDSRTQYYPVTPASAADANQLAAGEAGVWIDNGGQLTVPAWSFPWHGEPAGFQPKSPPSMYNPQTRLRIVQRGARWIAMHHDKRDDDLLGFDNLPKSVVLTNGSLRATVTLGPNVFTERPPAVERATFWWEGAGGSLRAGLSLNLSLARPAGLPPPGAVWRVRIAGLRPPGGEVVGLFDAVIDQFARVSEATYEMRWMLDPARLAEMQEFCSTTGELRYGTSVWVEDLTGHVGVPDRIVWPAPAALRVAVVPQSIPLGRPVSVTVTATNPTSGQPVTGTVSIAGQVAGSTGVPFTRTFTQAVAGVVDVPGLPSATIPFAFHTSTMRTSVEPASLPIGPPVRVTVSAIDTATGERVGGRVVIDGRDAGAANAPFDHTFGPTPPAGTVTAPYYRDAPISWPPLRWPALEVGISPSPIRPMTLVTYLMRAVDAHTRELVDGEVRVDGAVVARTNVAFPYRFVVRRVRERDPDTGIFLWVLIPPVITVVAPGYPEATIEA